MMDYPKLQVSFGRESHAQISRTEAYAWPALVELLTKKPAETADKERKGGAGWFCPATFEPTWRDSDNFVKRYALTLDYDTIKPSDVAAILAAYEKYAHVMYTTWSHTEEAPRLRLVMPLSRPVGYDEFQAISRKIAAEAGIELPSRESHVPAQYMFLPMIKPGAVFKKKITDGPWIDVDAVLASYGDNPMDRALWPHRTERDGVHRNEELQTPPDEKPGIVGDFCRAFDVPAAIAAFNLPYKPTGNPDRWTFDGGSRAEGAIIYDGGRKLHSHHDTDPARGQHNAFDLVRIHKFAGKDSGVREGTLVTERPSWRAMVLLTGERPEVAAAMAERDGVTELGEFGPGELRERPADMRSPSSFEDVVADTKRVTELLSKFHVYPAAVFAGGPPPKWRVKHFLPEVGLGAIYGPSGSGKSFTVIDCACAVQLGLPWRGKKTRPGRAIYIAAEGAAGVRSRVKAYSKEFGVPMEKLPAFIADAPNLIEAEDAVAIALSIEMFGGADVVIIDTLSASFIGNENAGEDMGRVVRNCQALSKRLNCFVWLVHHTGKDETKGGRGWSGLRAALDAEMRVEEGEPRLLTVTKMKDGETGAVYPFTLKTVELGRDEDGDPITSCVAVPAEMPQVIPGVPGKAPEPKGLNGKRVWEAVNRVNRHLMSEAEIHEALRKILPLSNKKHKEILDRGIGQLLAADYLTVENTPDRGDMYRKGRLKRTQVADEEMKDFE